MTSREMILQALKQNQSSEEPLLPALKASEHADDLIEKFETAVRALGATVVRISHLNEVQNYCVREFKSFNRIIVHGDRILDKTNSEKITPHSFEDVNLIILRPLFAVAENGAAWITDENLGDRALPFIAEHVALIVHGESIVPTMHEAYERIQRTAYAFGTFIAGPSKTADIEQSLVLGAHGPKSMYVFLKV